MNTHRRSLAWGAVLLSLLAAAPVAVAQNVTIDFITGSETQVNLGLDPNYLNDHSGADYDHLINAGLSGEVNLSLGGGPVTVPINGITFESDVNSYVESTNSYVSTRTFSLTAPVSSATISLTQAFTVNISNSDTITFDAGAPLVFDVGSDEILTVTPLSYSAVASPGAPSTGSLSATFELTQIPEPSTSAAVLGLATLGFAGLRRFRRRIR